MFSLFCHPYSNFIFKNQVTDIFFKVLSCQSTFQQTFKKIFTKLFLINVISNCHFINFLIFAFCMRTNDTDFNGNIYFIKSLWKTLYYCTVFLIKDFCNNHRESSLESSLESSFPSPELLESDILESIVALRVSCCESIIC